MAARKSTIAFLRVNQHIYVQELCLLTDVIQFCDEDGFVVLKCDPHGYVTDPRTNKTIGHFKWFDECLGFEFADAVHNRVGFENCGHDYIKAEQVLFRFFLEEYISLCGGNN